jgi:transketolase C-terminal domain/subunit
VAFDGDVGISTYSEDVYKDPALKERFFECRIAEQHMISCAAGLVAGGRIPISGRTPDDVLRHLGLSMDDVVKAGPEPRP